MTDKTLNFLTPLFGVYKTRIRVFFILTAIYIISIILLVLKISVTFVVMTTVLYIIENIALIIYDGEEFERTHKRFE